MKKKLIFICILSIVGMTLHAQEINLRKGLMLHLSLNGDVMDNSKYQHNVLAYGAKSTADRYGNADAAYLFDGVNDYMEVELPLPVENFTISVWAKKSEHNDYDNIIGWENSYFGLVMASNNQETTVWNNNTATNGAVWERPMRLHQWYHLLLTVNSDSLIEFYVNGKQKATGKYAYSEQNKLKIGNLNNSNFFHGKIDDIRIYSRVLEPLEIAALQNNQENEKPSERIEAYVRQKMNKWQLKGEFERSEDHLERTKDDNRQKILDQYITQAINLYGKQTFVFDDASLQKFDADNETYKISIENLQDIYIKVPLSDAKLVKDNWASVRFENIVYGLVSDKFVIKNTNVICANKQYTYFDATSYTYEGNVQVATHFDYLNFNIPQNQPNDVAKKSEIDTRIPKTNKSKPQTYALVIGNEDYSTFQTGLNSESDVDFAANDATIFKQYLVETLGVPEKNITLLINATLGQMKQGLSKLSNLAETQKGNAELIFYYAGHGLPHETTHEPYLIPVDISGMSIESGMKMSAVYGALTKFESKKITVFLDACFSGGARNQGLVALRTIKVKPKKSKMKGNLVVFSASSGDETSAPYSQMQHGLFTYFLLKKIQETKGDITYRELADYLEKTITLESVLINNKKQTPQTNGSTQVQDLWETWKF